MAMQPSIKNGDRFLMKENGWLTVTNYVRSNNVFVRFDDTGYETRTEAVMLKRGTVKDYLKKDILGVACLGAGSEIAHIGRKATWTYTRWFHMIVRCYGELWKSKKPTYDTCTISEDWLNFQTFAVWAKQQAGYEEESWQVDKDILVRGNKHYSAETCCFVPNEINTLFKGKEKFNGLPLGVSKVNKKYRAMLSTGVQSHCVETFSEAMMLYKESKEQRIKQQADKWRTKIDPRAYDALMNYQVEITD